MAEGLTVYLSANFHMYLIVSLLKFSTILCPKTK
jgi:hypothetical protein